jgi:hypothetical protein
MPAIFAILSRLPWKYIGIALAVVAVLAFAYNRGRHSRDTEVATLNQSIANLKAASAAAAARNLAEVRAIETKNVAIQKDMEDALSQQGSSARAALDAYILRHPASSGHAGVSGVSQAASPAQATPSAPEAAIVARTDLEACTDAFVMARGWQAWWSQVSAAQP